jgi:benzoyl-CoA 2,3-dioxygenase component A
MWRQYSIASARNGERPGYNNLALTVKRVVEDHQGQPVRGVASNYLCDLQVGDKVQVIGPFGSSFLMPNHPRSHIVICTGTGSAHARHDGMAPPPAQERQVRQRETAAVLRCAHASGAALFRPPAKPAQGFHRHQLRLSRAWPVSQALCAGRHARALGRSHGCCATTTRIYVCGLKSMEDGVVLALR